MKRIFCLSVLLLGSALLSYSQSILIRTGSYTYLASTDQSLEQAKKIALERVKLKIIEDEFGTVVGVSNISKAANIEGASSSSFLSIGETEVKGEWVSTVGEPSFEMSFQDGFMVVKVTVTGKIREITSSSVDLDVRILRNGISDRDESDVLKHGDCFYVLFRSPVNGYVAVYQYDSDGVFRLLPYSGSEFPSVPVKAGKEYIFFHVGASDGVSLRSNLSKADGHYNIICTVPMDLCRYYIIFSKNNFSVPNDNITSGAVPTIDFGAFQKWIGKIKSRDSELVVIPRDVTLKNK